MIDFTKIFGYPIYQVGGCVRDELLGVPVKDIDIASDLTPESFKKLCSKLKFKTHDTGIEHGTISVMIDGELYEHTTFRKDVSCDGRNATIEYSKTIEEDLSRRDFTINAMARLGGTIIDPYHGRLDLKEKKLKTVGSAHERFSEDYLRIVRAARFISRLNLKADKELIEAAKKLAPRITQYVSIERILDEIIKAQSHGSQFFVEADNLGFLNVLLPEVKKVDSSDKTRWINLIKKAENKNELIYLAAILTPLLGDKAEEKAVNLKCSRQISRGIGTLYNHQKSFEQLLDPGSLRDLMVVTKEYYPDLKEFCLLLYSDDKSTVNNINAADEIENKVIESIKKPLINGEFLIKEGLTPSPKFKTILDICGRLQAAGETQERLIEQARNEIKNI